MYWRSTRSPFLVARILPQSVPITEGYQASRFHNLDIPDLLGQVPEGTERCHVEGSNVTPYSRGRTRITGWDFNPPEGVPDEVATVYHCLVRPLLLANSLLSNPSWPNEGADYLCSYAEHLGAACQNAHAFLRREEVRL